MRCYERASLRLPQATSNRPMISNNNIEPALLDDTNLDSDDLWEVVINAFLKEHLGWKEQVDMGELIRRGELGIEGAPRFFKYFIEKRGVSVDFSKESSRTF